jgi:hypothetical protein
MRSLMASRSILEACHDGQDDLRRWTFQIEAVADADQGASVGTQFLDDLERVADAGAGQAVEPVYEEAAHRTSPGISAKAVKLWAGEQLPAAFLGVLGCRWCRRERSRRALMAAFWVAKS